VTFLLFKTSGEMLGSFAEGWAEPNNALSDELMTCREQSIDIQIENGDPTLAGKSIARFRRQAIRDKS
jgi:hypothetical protein